MSDTKYTLIPLGHAILNGQTVDAVNARDLHRFLESKQQFADWIKARIEQYAFTQDVDFTIIHSSMNNSAGRPLIEYYISLDMAKELSMVERSEKGKEARQYFIECERRLLQQPKRLSPTELFALQVAVNQEHDQRISTVEKTLNQIVEKLDNTPPLTMQIVPFDGKYLQVDTTGKFMTVPAFIMLHYRNAKFPKRRSSGWARSLRCLCERRGETYYSSKYADGSRHDYEFPVGMMLEFFKAKYPNYTESAQKWSTAPYQEGRKNG